MNSEHATRIPHRCGAEIDLAALERNLKSIRASLPASMKYVAVVKADAYGHGLPQAAARMMHSGADLFAVANVSEAAALRELGSDWPVLLLSPLLPEEDRFLAEYKLAATLSSEDEIKRFATVGQNRGEAIPVHLKIDTGMGRLGVWHTEAAALCEKITSNPHLRLAGIFTHFASPEDVAFTDKQRQLFLQALGNCRELSLDEIFVHADNSAGLASMPEASPFNAVRVGLLQFGILPHPHSLLSAVNPQPVFSFRTRVGVVKKLPEGTTISYGRTHTLSRDSNIAVLCAGYGDGIPRAASNRAKVLIHGQFCPVLGCVTMDQTIVDVTDLPNVTCGDEVVLVGRQQGAEISITEFSEWSDTIPWETLCSVTKRVPRLYRTPLGI